MERKEKKRCIRTSKTKHKNLKLKEKRINGKKKVKRITTNKITKYITNLNR